jgi:Domain of unknown function (DUF1883)
MNFLNFDLGHQQGGEMVEVTLTRGANVRLLDSSNCSNYKARRAYRCYGGLAKQSPVRIGIPSSGIWHLIVDMQGLRGSTDASVRVLQG